MTVEPENFSPQAAARFTTAINQYADSLEGAARQCAKGEEVVREGDVRDGLKLIGPTGESKLVDYVKRFTFLLIGVAITLGHGLFTSPESPTKGDVGLFAGAVAASAVLFAVALVADVPWIRKHLLRQDG
jgi:hypothetical protein